MSITTKQMKKKTITIRLSQDIFDFISKKAAMDERSFTYMLEKTLREILEKNTQGQ